MLLNLKNMKNNLVILNIKNEYFISFSPLNFQVI